MNSVVTLHRRDALRSFNARPFRVFTDRQMSQISQLAKLPEEQQRAMRIVASVLPFRVNEYVINELIDWRAVPHDPIFQLVFPQQGMLSEKHFARMAKLHDSGADAAQTRILADQIRAELNPHPAGQMEMNIPQLDGQNIDGLQHKYRETVLFFPSQGQTCHSYCSFCFRWAQFVGDRDLRMASNQADTLQEYLLAHPEVTDLLMTGGDPMVMKTRHLSAYLDPLTRPEFEHVQTVRLGTKSLTFWPHRFVTDEDADDLLGLLARLVNAGKHVSIMAHYNHAREMSTPIAREAIRRLRDTGVQIRSQGPLLAHINDSAETWADMWREQVKLGIVPYYLFVERDTGARCYFEVPLVGAWEIYRQAMQQVSGVGRTARGPSMSAGPGKVEIQGVTEIQGEKVFVLRFIQARNPDWVQQPFFAQYDPKATWLDQLKPAFGADKFFFSDEYAAMTPDAL
ncbi:L-lysine 2,3-aminomutase [Ectothiorhodosinus mongolicus]|uniref:L-lysine 2,3-aminomutase n=1 Tax=Ectothiorhodosinus mongolicus TaxID=233100 RepID=A0A1R3VPC5_9GAMM|nr:lysine 2,3-aminomutase [Ectothiorhodosinus mongolicus]ULX57860.1 lysine 2,3-aminomutase [Ectothiorhodosinus mongolicus]SIT65785.1 L-lysine 2,3-aminomutase [Ectothiorhodosinus mongolicus]